MYKPSITNSRNFFGHRKSRVRERSSFTPPEYYNVLITSILHHKYSDYRIDLAFINNIS